MLITLVALSAMVGACVEFERVWEAILDDDEDDDVE